MSTRGSRTLINVCGMARSGTTMLDVMIGNAPNAFSCGEVFSWYRPSRTHHHRINCPCGQNPCPEWEKVKDLPESRFHAEAFERLDVRFLVDSSKNLAWIVDNMGWATKADMRVVNVLIWKLPIDIAHSLWKRGLGLWSWRDDFIRYHKRLLGLRMPFVTVNYNELIKNPAARLADVCRVIGMEYFEGKERFWEKHHHHLFGSLSIRNQVESRHSEIKADEYLEGFRKEAEMFTRIVDADREVQNVLAELRARDVSRFEPAVFEGFRFERRSIPPWYYVLRLRSLVRRYFPMKSPSHWK